MKTLLFIGLIVSSVIYLAVSESSMVGQWLQQQSPEHQMAKISVSLNDKVAQQMADFKAQVVAEQQNKVDLLQDKLSAMAQQIEQLEAQQVAASVVQAQVPAQTRQAVVEVIPLNDYAAHDVAEPSSQYSNNMVAAVQHQPVASAPVATPTEPLMTKLQRRKALQNLSQRMALKALSAGR